MARSALLLDDVEVLSQQGPVIDLAGADVGAKGEVFFVELETAKRFGGLDIVDQQRAQQLRRQYVERHHVLVQAADIVESGVGLAHRVAG